jgi:hypothetical protein
MNMMDRRHDARERILALERIRVVETELIELSLPLLQRLQKDLSCHLGKELPTPLIQKLNQGEKWWQPELTGYSPGDPRIFPVVLDVIEQVEKESQNRWQLDPAPVEGVCYQQLVAALREVLDRRTELARIAGVL